MTDQSDPVRPPHKGRPDRSAKKPEEHPPASAEPPLFDALNNWQVVEIEGKARAIQEETNRTAGAYVRAEAAHPTAQSAAHGADAPRTIQDETDDTIVLTIQERTHTVAPGQAAVYAVVVLNNGQTTTTFTPSITPSLDGGIDPSWVVFTPAHTRLHPGASARFEITLTPPRLPSTRAGARPFAIALHAQTVPARCAQVSATLTVAALVDFTLGELRPSRVQSSWQHPTASLIAPLTNHSNVNAYFQIDGVTPAAEHRFEFATPGAVAPQIGRTSFVLTPGQSIHVACRMTPESRSLAGMTSRKTPFRITAAAMQHGSLASAAANGAADASGKTPWDVSRTVQGSLVQLPLLGPGLMSALAGCALTLLLGVGLIGLALFLTLLPGLLRQPAPVAQVASPPPAALEIVVKIAEPVAVPNAVLPMLNAQGPFAPISAAAASNPAPAQNQPTQDQPASDQPAQDQPIIVQPAPTIASIAAADSAPPVAPNQPLTGAGEPPLVTADQITTPGQNAPAANQPAHGEAIVQPNMITNPGDTPGNTSGDTVQSQASAPQPASGEAIGQPQPVADNASVNSAGANTATMTYEQLFRSVAQQYNLDWRILAAQAYVESSFNPLALGNKGDLGLMQVLPSTWKEWAPRVDVADPFDSYSNVLVAATYLDYLRTSFAAQGYTDVEWMLIAYNWGPSQVHNFLSGGGELENLDESLQQYARNVLRIAESLPRE